MQEVTALLARARAGDANAAERLFEAVYADLREIAGRQLGRVAPGSMRATSLVHEAWFRLGRPAAMGLNDRQHFFAVAARAMRQLAIDHARERATAKRGGGVEQLPLHEVEIEGDRGLRDADLLALDQAMEDLRRLEPSLAELVEMRFFAGLEIAEVAELTARSTSSLVRDWRRARAFLRAAMGGGNAAFA